MRRPMRAAGAAAVVAVLAGALAARCSGGDDGDDGARGSVTGTPAMSASPGASATRATDPGPAPGASATASTGGTGPTPATPGTPAATATPAAMAEPTTAPTPSPTPVQPRKHGDGTFTIVVSQGEARAAVRVEVAATLDERQRGLMFRQELAEDAGMLFLFGREVQTGFWMRNTYVPLDIAYIGADQRVIEVKQGKPLDESPLTPDGPYRFVLEVNAGWFERHGMGPGAVVALPDGLPPATDN